MSRPRISAQNGWRIFRWPLAIALVTTIGLIAALIGDGAFDVVSWVALGLTLIVMTAAWLGWSAE